MTTSKSKLKKVSKFLSYVLRHCPEDIGLTLDKQGWASIAELVDKASSQIVLSYELIEEVVITNEKQRFKISEDKQKISANQGHSVQVDLKLESKKPPIELYHGTATRFLDSIKNDGLKRVQRHHVHQSTDISTT
ncbi:MAG: RNA 2'-phosphotransferase, partial [Psychrosphaera sp.]|nr:RNA 2'-phosphotransferase [Psychrosphaera sp.]